MQGEYCNKSWYLIYTKPLKERLALENLERQGYTAYLPMLTLRKRKRGVYVQVTEPMFPRYLFVHLDKQNDNWSPIRSTRGVGGIVRFGMDPARVPDDFVQMLKDNVQREEEKASAEPLFDKGDKVRIVDGPFAGYEAVFDTQKASERAIVLLDIASNYTKMQIDSDNLEKV